MFKLALAAAVLAAALAVSSAQLCDMPQEWEARQIRFDPNRREYHNHTSQYRTYARYAYDGINMRKWRYEDAAFGDEPDRQFVVLELYREKKAYVTDVKYKNCSVFTIEHDFHRHDINKDADFVGYEYIGSSPNAIMLSQFVARNTTYHGEPAHQYQTFAAKACVPVRDDYFTNETGFHYEEFSDVTLGISNPNIWIPPSDCRPARQALTMTFRRN